jgi:hypothetical protein
MNGLHCVFLTDIQYRELDVNNKTFQKQANSPTLLILF